MRVFVGIGIAGGWLPSYILNHEYVDRINLWRCVTYMRLCMYSYQLLLYVTAVIRYTFLYAYTAVGVFLCR